MYEIPYTDFTKAVLVMARMTAIIAVFPIFGFRAIPILMKGGLAILLTIIVFPLVQIGPQPLSTQPLELFIILIKEVVVGLIVGYSTTLLFYGIQMAGHILGIQMGFGIISVVDPLTDVQVSLIGQLNYIIALLIFLTLDGHHFLIRALVSSYDYISLGGAHFPSGLMQKINFMTGAIYDVALRIAAPVFVSLFLTDVVLGIMARVAPQMNVFIIGFPLKIGVGLLVMSLVVSFFPYVFGKMFQQFKVDIMEVIKLFGM